MERQNFIDWMKTLGMFAIVVGHIIGDPHHIFNLASQPVYTKQLGVCFFIFIMGWGLANEKKRSIKVVFNRLFPVYFFGVFFAVLLSGIYSVTIGDINESNYLPFFLGVNVLFNYFPANPTTWYIGTYLHVLLFWFVFLKQKQVTFLHVVIASVAEITIRGLLLHKNMDFVAYMTLPNWITIFYLGAFLYRRKDSAWKMSTNITLAIWFLFVALWASSYNTLIDSTSFPFRDVTGDAQTFSKVLLQSVLISFVYIFNTFVFFKILKCLPKSKIVLFFARNSLVTFIVHMPLIYAFSNDFYGFFESKQVGQWVFIIIIFLGGAILSEVLNRLINVSSIQNKTWMLLEKLFQHNPSKK